MSFTQHSSRPSARPLAAVIALGVTTFIAGAASSLGALAFDGFVRGCFIGAGLVFLAGAGIALGLVIGKLKAVPGDGSGADSGWLPSRDGARR